MTDQDQRIITRSHIDEEHAQSEYFPEALSADGLFSWHHGAPMYVGINCAMTGLPDYTAGHVGHYSIYLPWGNEEVPTELLARARAFWAAVQDEIKRRQDAEEEEAADAALDAPPVPAHVTALAERYGGVTYQSGELGPPSERAWDAADEESWAALRAHGL